jgi:Protein of unknown function (DUF3631)
MSYTPLDLVETYLRRFVAYPSEHALVAHTLWIAHTHLMEEFDTTPRLAFMSAEPMSGKTRALEVSEHIVCDPIMGFSMSAAVTIRLVAERRRTVLFDEIDAVYGTVKRQEANGELVSYMNAGYRRGAKCHRCATGNGSKHEPIEYEAFAPLAVAGLRDLPDALATRAIVIRMRRRAPDEKVEPFRIKHHVPQAKPIKDALVDWCEGVSFKLPESPDMPANVVDRASDIWEPLIAIADVAHGDWPTKARDAAVYFTRANAEDEARSSGVDLLDHIKEAFGAEQHIATTTLVERLCNRDESPWANIRGRALDPRGLALRLKNYGIKSKTVRVGDKTAKGYDVADFADTWKRYLLSPSDISHKGNSRHIFESKNNFVTDVTDVTDGEAIPDDNLVAFDERAASLEYEGGLTRDVAEALAATQIPLFLRKRTA